MCDFIKNPTVGLLWVLKITVYLRHRISAETSTAGLLGCCRGLISKLIKVGGAKYTSKLKFLDDDSFEYYSSIALRQISLCVSWYLIDL